MRIVGRDGKIVFILSSPFPVWKIVSLTELYQLNVDLSLWQDFAADSSVHDYAKRSLEGSVLRIFGYFVTLFDS